MFTTLFAVLVGAELLLSAAVSRGPRAFARFAVLPVGKRVTVPLPARVAALVLQPRSGTGTYRVPSDREFALASLPGEARVTGERQILTFVPELNWVLAKARGFSAVLTRVEVSGVEGNLVLTAHRIPGEIPWLILLVTMLPRQHWSLHAHLLSAVLVLAWSAGSIAWAQRSARECVAAVAEEMRRRVAIANGDDPHAARALPKILANEWACACGKVNNVRRATCGRCWAQKGGG